MSLIIMSVSSHPHGGTADKNNQLKRHISILTYCIYLFLCTKIDSEEKRLGIIQKNTPLLTGVLFEGPLFISEIARQLYTNNTYSHRLN